MDAAQLPSTRTLRFWGKRAGGFYDTKRTKGLSEPNGLIFKVKRGGPASSNSSAKPKHYTSILVAHAAARGFVNGVSTKGAHG